MLYMGYLLLLALLDFLVTGMCVRAARDTRLILRSGTIGFLATYWAVRKLYSAIRID